MAGIAAVEAADAGSAGAGRTTAAGEATTTTALAAAGTESDAAAALSAALATGFADSTTTGFAGSFVLCPVAGLLLGGRNDTGGATAETVGNGSLPECTVGTLFAGSVDEAVGVGALFNQGMIIECPQLPP